MAAICIELQDMVSAINKKDSLLGEKIILSNYSKVDNLQRPP